MNFRNIWGRGDGNFLKFHCNFVCFRNSNLCHEFPQSVPIGNVKTVSHVTLTRTTSSHFRKGKDLLLTLRLTPIYWFWPQCLETHVAFKIPSLGALHKLKWKYWPLYFIHLSVCQPQTRSLYYLLQHSLIITSKKLGIALRAKSQLNMDMRVPAQ